MRRNSVPASYAIVESWPDLGDPHKILVQPPEAPIIARKSTKCDPISFNPASYRLSNGAKPFVPRAQPKLSSSPASLYPLLEELDVGEGLSCLDHSELAAQFVRGEQIASSEPPVMFCTMIGTVYSQVMIRDTIKVAIQNTERFLPECLHLDSISRLVESFHSLAIELLDILKFGDPRLYTTPITKTNESTQPETGLGTMKYTSNFHHVHRDIRQDASYATFPISNNLIVFARIAKRKQPSVRIRRLEIAELLLECTDGSSEAQASPSNFQVIGKDMLKAYVKMLSRTRRPLGWSGWYPTT
ncbi:hypothetical protein IFR04_004638 [Cadophora malorum]|uniref:Uncharacterized protein n=1 Tax=Cadophora malorum TaxID=108018 RepID=A0A8H8BSQ1_9HELO|nr:hypothetical protein IFR04_004638 [Cadophora malorum]